MRIRLLLLLLFTFASCLKPKQEKQTQAKAASLITESNSIKQLNPHAEKALNFNSELLDKNITELLNSKSTKKTKYQEHGGGDCYGAYSIFNNQNLKQEIVLDKYDCGDYGFANRQFLLTGDSIGRVRTYKFEYFGVEAEKTKFKVAENIYYFSGDKVLIKNRSKYTTDFSDTLLNNLKFSEKIMLADSVYKAKFKDLEEILASTVLEDWI